LSELAEKRGVSRQAMHKMVKQRLERIPELAAVLTYRKHKNKGFTQPATSMEDGNWRDFPASAFCYRCPALFRKVKYPLKSPHFPRISRFFTKNAAFSPLQNAGLNLAGR